MVLNKSTSLLFFVFLEYLTLISCLIIILTQSNFYEYEKRRI
jgi:hypothetical protein